MGEINLSLEQAEDVLDLLNQHETLCHKTRHGTLVFEHLELREFLEKAMEGTKWKKK